MENASKALLIAGGILISIIVISLFVSMYGKMSSLQRTQKEQQKMEQISAFNAEYEAFDKDVMYGADVVTLANKVKNNNEKNAEDNITLLLNNIKINNGNELLNMDKDFKTKMFKCTSIEYNNRGKVCKICIENK